MDAGRIVVLLEQVKEKLAVQPTEQKKSAEQKKASTAAAKQALKSLMAKSKAGRSAGNDLKATGAK